MAAITTEMHVLHSAAAAKHADNGTLCQQGLQLCLPWCSRLVPSGVTCLPPP